MEPPHPPSCDPPPSPYPPNRDLLYHLIHQTGTPSTTLSTKFWPLYHLIHQVVTPSTTWSTKQSPPLPPYPPNRVPLYHLIHQTESPSTTLSTKRRPSTSINAGVWALLLRNHMQGDIQMYDSHHCGPSEGCTLHTPSQPACCQLQTVCSVLTCTHHAENASVHECIRCTLVLYLHHMPQRAIVLITPSRWWRAFSWDLLKTWRHRRLGCMRHGQFGEWGLLSLGEELSVFL